MESISASDKIAWFLGLMEGDGHISNGKNYDYKISVCLDSEILAKNTSIVINDIFSIMPKIYKYKNKKCYEVYFRSKNIWEKLKDFKVPSESKLNFIGGLIDAEGHVEVAGYRIIIPMKSDTTADEVFRILEEFNFMPKKRNDGWWRIYIYGKKNLQKILPYISHSKKIDSIVQILNSSTRKRV